MRQPQPSFHLIRRFPPRKQKSQITRTLRPGRNVIMHPRRNLQARNPNPRASRRFALNSLQHTTRRHRNHHHARSRRLASPISHRHLHRPPQQQLFQSNRFVAFRTHEPQRSRAQSTDRPRRHLQRPNAFLINPKLRVHRSVRQSQRPHRSRRAVLNFLLLHFAQPRRRNVDRLLEKRPLQRISLVTNRQHPKLSVRQQPFNRHFPSRNVSLHNRLIQIRFPASQNFRRLQNAPQP